MSLTTTCSYDNSMAPVRFTGCRDRVYLAVHLARKWKWWYLTVRAATILWNSSHTIRSSERNKRHPQIVLTATICTFMQIISVDSHWASARSVRVVRLVSIADNRTQMLSLLLTASNSCHCIACMCLIQPLLMFAGFSKEINAALE